MKIKESTVYYVRVSAGIREGFEPLLIEYQDEGDLEEGIRQFYAEIIRSVKFITADGFDPVVVFQNGDTILKAKIIAGSNYDGEITFCELT